jgi:hypothetical protein
MTKGRRPWSTGQKLTLTSVLISALSFIFAVCALLYTVHKEREMKIIDLLSHYQQRYDQIAYEVKSEVQALPEAQARPWRLTTTASGTCNWSNTRRGRPGS